MNQQPAKLQKNGQKYMDMYTDDLISREELNTKIGGMRKEIERLEIRRSAEEYIQSSRGYHRGTRNICAYNIRHTEGMTTGLLIMGGKRRTTPCGLPWQ